MEPSTSSAKSSKSADVDKSLQDDLENNEDSEGGLFVPIKKRKKEKPKEKVAAEHELKMIQLLTQLTLGSASFKQPPFQAIHHSQSARYAKGGPLTADYNQQCPGRAFEPNVSNRPGLPEGPLGYFTPACNMQSTSNEDFDDRNVYHNNF